MTLSEIKTKRADAQKSLNAIQSFVTMYQNAYGRLDMQTKQFLIEDAEKAFEQYFSCAKEQGLPISSVTAKYAAERYVAGCEK